MNTHPTPFRRITTHTTSLEHLLAHLPEAARDPLILLLYALARNCAQIILFIPSDERLWRWQKQNLAHIHAEHDDLKRQEEPHHTPPQLLIEYDYRTHPDSPIRPAGICIQRLPRTGEYQVTNHT